MENSTKECPKCGHVHHEQDLCQSAHCSRCGLGGNLTTMSCQKAAETNSTIEDMLRKGQYKRLRFKRLRHWYMQLKYRNWNPLHRWLRHRRWNKRKQEVLDFLRAHQGYAYTTAEIAAAMNKDSKTAARVDALRIAIRQLQHNGLVEARISGRTYYFMPTEQKHK